MSSVEPAPLSPPATASRAAQAFIAADGRIVAANEPLATLAGRPLAQLPGLIAADTLPALIPSLAVLLPRVLADGEPLLELEAREDQPATGTARRWLLSLSPVRSRTGHSLGVDLELRSWAMALDELILSADVAALVTDLRGELDMSDEPFRAIFNQAAMGLILVGPKGGLVRVNPGFCAIVGYSAEELLAARPQDIIHPDDLEADREQIRQLMAGEPVASIEQRFLRRDGAVVWTRVSRSLIVGPGGELRFGLIVVQDISAEKQLQAAKAERAHLLQVAEQARNGAELAAMRAVALLSLTAALSRALTPERVSEAVIDEACGILGAVAGVVTLFDPAQECLTILGSQGYPGELLDDWQRIPLTQATPLSDAARRGEPVLLGSTEAHTREYPRLSHSYASMGIHALAALPLRLDSQLIGVLGLTFDKPHVFDDEERTYLMTMAGLCAQALERARLSAAERAALSTADEALAMLDMVIDSAPIGMAYVDHELRYRRINPRLAAMNSLPVAAHIGQRVRELFPQAAAIWEPQWRQVLTSGEPMTDLVLSGSMPDGSMRYALVSYYPVRVGEGQVLGVGILVSDITQQREAEQERARLLASEQEAREAAQAAQASAEAAVQLRDAFLSIAAHELKTPLTSLLGQAQLLERRLAKDGQLTELNERSLQVVVGQARRLNHLISDLLDGAHLEIGQLSIKRRPVDLAHLIRQFVEELQPTAPGHCFRLELPEAPLMVLADPVRLEQVIQNLLSNAVKYSRRGSEVRVELRRADDKALLSIHDQGVGIPAQAIPRLFDRFYRVESSETASVSGVGVGLYVVREIVLLHGGAVHVASTLGEGSSFTVELPLGA